MDISPYIVAKSDQLNADDLMGGPITVKIEAVRKGDSDQPVVIKISGGHQPWKPCKTSLRVLVAAMGPDAAQWIGQWVTLYRDEHVKWAGVEVGGIRIKALSSIDKKTTLQLTETRGKKTAHTIEPLKPPTESIAANSESKGPRITADQLANLEAMLEEVFPDLAERNEKTSKLKDLAGVRGLEQIPSDKYERSVQWIERHREVGL